MENFCKFQKSMEDNVKLLLGVTYDNRKKHLGRKYESKSPSLLGFNDNPSTILLNV